jgi:hypothetical protein
MKLEPGKFCPLIKKDCVGLQCSWFTLVRGNNPQTGQEIDEWGCAMTWLPVLLIENSQQQRQTGAAVESFRNEVVRNAEANREVVQGMLQNGPSVLQVIGQGNPLIP